MAKRRTYQEVHGPVPRVPIFDAGLAQQTSGPPVDDIPTPRSRMIGRGSDVGNTVFEALPCKNGDEDVDCILRLLDRGDIGIQYTVGPGPNAKHSLLHWACQHANSVALVEALLERGADVCATEMRGRVPWTLARRVRDRDAVATAVFAAIDSATPRKFKSF